MRIILWIGRKGENPAEPGVTQQQISDLDLPGRYWTGCWNRDGEISHHPVSSSNTHAAEADDDVCVGVFYFADSFG